MNFGNQTLDLHHTRVMGILNVTPDSFSDGGDFFCPQQALQRAQEIYEEGADFIDIGGESTRPGAKKVSLEDELQRVIPVITAIARQLPIIISIDTSKAEVMCAAVAAGAAMINDVRALQAPGALRAAAALQVPVCLMHMQGQPRQMQHNPCYDDVVAEVFSFLKARSQQCQASGIAAERLLIDPGFGFGKSLTHNLRLLAQLDTFLDLGHPLLVGLSRKAMIGTLLDQPVAQRLHGSLATASLAAWQGASIVRVHDVKATVENLTICNAVRDKKERNA